MAFGPYTPQVDAHLARPHNQGMITIPPDDPFVRVGTVLGFVISGLLYALPIYALLATYFPSLSS